MKNGIVIAFSFLLAMAADAQISIIGPATPAGDWVTDYDMVQDAGDSAIWTRSIYLADGVVKFRKNHDWVLNWGDNTFPSGTGILDGPNIPADPGFYLVRFDTSTLAYSFSQGFVGINNESPNVALDISGAFAHRTAHLDVTSNAATVPPNVSLVNLVGAPTGAVYLETFPGIDGQRLIIHNSTSSGQPASFDGAYDIAAGGTIELVFVNAIGWKLTSGGGGGDSFWSQTGATDAISNTNEGGFYSENPSIVNSDPGPLTVPVSGPGTRLMWMPEKSAFRVGTVDGAQWDADSIGSWSFAAGRNNVSKGKYSTSFGEGNTASGESSNAFGKNNTSSNFRSTAFGESNYASGFASTTFGSYNLASGGYSTALGSYTQAIGSYTTSFGNSTIARSYLSVAMGMWNDTIAGSSLDSWVPADPLLTIGNGLGNGLRSNALTIYKNASLTAKRFDPLLTDPGVIAVPLSGTGTRMMWLSEKSAFRVGTVDGTYWDATNIGTWSFATGKNTTAYGTYSFASGFSTYAASDGSTALGYGTQALYPYSTAIGYYAKASGQYSMAMGQETKAMGEASTSLGKQTQAKGYYSASLGLETRVNAYGALGIGQYNDTIPTSSSSSWVATDPLLMLGNGTNHASRSNAMVVYKNGNADISGYTRLGTSAENAPRIKMKEFASTTAATNNGTVSIAHGLTSSKIIGVEALVEYSTGSFVPVAYTYSPELNFNYLITATDIIIVNNATTCAGTSICDKPVKVVVTYKE